jgi:putative membrane protein
MSGMDSDEPGEIDYRFSLANERTFLAWIRTAFALVAGGVAAAKALEFNHEVWRWVIAGPPIVAGALLALDARARWRRYEEAMRARRPLPAGRGIRLAGAALAVYAIVALVVVVLDG